MKKSSIQLIGSFCALVIFLLFSPSVMHGQTYCPSSGGPSLSISNVTFSGLENNSGDADYTDFTGQSANVLTGLTYNNAMTVKMNTTLDLNKFVTVFIDWNQDGVFNTTDEYYYFGVCTTNCAEGLTGSITVPSTALLGQTRMRVIAAFGVARTSACGIYPHGEVEDYTVNVSAGDCAPDFDYVVTNDCSNDTYSVTAILNGFGSNTFVTISMTRSDNNQVVVATIPFGLPEGYAYPLINDIPAGVTISASVQPNDPQCNQQEEWLSLGCYCIPEYDYGCDSGDQISNVSLSGETIDLNNSSGCSENSYEFYGNIGQPDLAPGQLYTLNVSTDYYWPSDEDVIAWIDYNKDGNFDEDEIIANTNGNGLAASGTSNFDFTIPQTIDAGSYRLRVRMVFYEENFNACDSYNYGETEDYKVEILQLANCSGTPTAGIAAMDQFGVCATSAFTLSVAGSSDPADGLVKGWQSSPAGQNIWTNIEGNSASSSNYTHTGGILQATDFRYKITCTHSSESDYSNVVQVSMNPGLDCFCVPTGGSNNSDEIRNFSLSNLDNASAASEGVNGYSDYTETVDPAILVPGEPYIASLLAGSGFGDHGAAIWIDYNDNGVFEESELVAFIGSTIGANATANFPAFTPANVPGLHRLRVQYSYNLSGEMLVPCEMEMFSETEDYMVELTELDPCEGAPSAGTVDATGYDVCANTPIVLVTTGASDMAGGLFRGWQSSPAGQNVWTDIADSYATSYTYTGGINQPTDFRFKVICEFSQESDISDAVTLGLTPVDECYCTPTSTGTLAYIVGFTAEADGGQDIENTGTGVSLDGNGYSDYTNLPALLANATAEINFTANTTAGETTGLKIWVDWNQDGHFDLSGAEVVYASTSYSAAHTGSFIVPENASGTYRMRVGASYIPGTGPASPCALSSSGEYEDYIMQVTPLDGCTEAIAGTIVGGTEMEVCANAPFSLSVTGNSSAADGLIRTWQSSPVGAGVWTDLNISSSTLNVAGISTPKDYRYSVDCAYAGSDVSGVISISLNPNPEECYCTPGGTNASYFINNFTTSDGIEDISNTSSGFSAGGYGDFTNMTVKQIQTQAVDFTVDIQGGTAGFRIWVDWNQDGEFGTNEVAYISPTYGSTFSGSINVPESALEGTTRMRMVSHWLNATADISPCTPAHTYGEFEDYTFEVVALEACAGTPSAGTPVDAAFNVCALEPFLISVSGASDPAEGMARGWQSSPAGQNIWTDIQGAAARNYTMPDGIYVPMDFRYKMTCSFSGQSDISDIIQVGLNGVLDCYCIPQNTSDKSTSFINHVSTNEAVQDLDNQSGFTIGGYADYTGTDTLIVNPSQTIDFSIAFQAGVHNVQVWVDFNLDGVFSTNENVISSTNMAVASPFSGTFTVPAELPLGSYRIRVRADDYYVAPTCSDLPSGETEDYILTVVESEVCAGTPSGGTIADANLMVCASVNFTLSVSGASTSIEGIERIWQSSPAGQNVWTDIAGATATSYTVQGGIATAKDYRYKVTCTNSEESDISNVLEVNLKPSTECYCTPVYSTGCTSGDRISNVNLVGETITLDNTSECSPNSYGDYKHLAAADLAPGNSYSISVSTDYSFPTSEQVKVWIDYNQNGSFDAEELIANSGGVGLPNGTGTYTFVIPSSLDAGNYTMRVRLGYGSVAPLWDACESVFYGETEDYTVEILQLDGCFGTPTAGTSAEEQINVCAAQAFTVSVTGSSDPADGLVKVWQSSPAGQNVWTDITGIAATSTSYTRSGGVMVDTDFRYRVTCTNSSETVYSNVVQVSLKPGVECYCTPTGAGNNSDEIRSFMLSNITNPSPAGEGLDGPGYSDYTETVDPAILVPGESYVASLLSGGGSGNHGAAIWIDFNDNGVFELSEKVTFIANSIGANITATFPAFVPPNVPGLHRLRVQYHYFKSGAELNPCVITSSYSETEDYMVELTELDACAGTPSAGTVDDTGYNVCANVPIVLNTTGASDMAGGLTRNWQSSPAGQNVWTDIAGASGTSYTYLAGISVPTDFRFRVECSFSQELDISEVLTIGITPANECYCIPSSTSTSYYIDSFTATGDAGQNITNNNSGLSAGGYGDFSDQIVEVNAGYNVNFTAGYVGGSSGLRIWVDWNQDGIFQVGELVFDGPSSASHAGSFATPESGDGSYRMRVANQWLGGSTNPCATGFTYGEFEDYTIVVIPLESCTEAIAGTVVGNTEMEVCANSPFTLTVDGNSAPADGLIRTWQSSPAGAGVWTDLNVGSSSIVINDVETPTDYRYHVECINGDSDNSEVISISINPNTTECYCIPGGIVSSYFIANFSTTGGTTNITNSNSGFSTGGYGNFTSMNVTQVHGGVVNFTANFGGGQDGGFRIWVDWNQDGQFDIVNEVAFKSTTWLVTQTGSFTVPAGVPYGPTRMRIVYDWNNSQANIDPCLTNSEYGEFEDYTLIVTEPIWDCPDLSANIGDSCDDGNPATVNDKLDANCNCAGITPPVGSFCESAIPVECNVSTASYNSANSIATNTSGCTLGSKGLWFSFEGTGLDIKVTTTATFNHEMSINIGECGGLSSVACVDQGTGTETYTITSSIAGEMYYVYVANWSSTGATTGTIGIKIECTEASEATLNGTVAWNSSCGERDATVKLYVPGTAVLVASYDVSIQANGSFSIPGVETGTFDVIVKVDRYLAKGMKNVVITTGANNLAVGAIIPGDLNNDGFVNFTDFTILATALSSDTFNPVGDLNCDGFVNFTDFTILSNSMGEEGDTAPLQ